MLISIVSQLVKTNKEKNIESFSEVAHSFNGFSLFLLILSLLLAMVNLVSCLILAYKCNQKENIIIKSFILLFVLFFSEFYIPYYLIKYGILGRKCKNNVIVRSNNNVRRNNVRR
jgi:hypothetical protein